MVLLCEEGERKLKDIHTCMKLLAVFSCTLLFIDYFIACKSLHFIAILLCKASPGLCLHLERRKLSHGNF